MKIVILLTGAITLMPMVLSTPVAAQCQFTARGCTTSLDAYLERLRQDRIQEDLRRDEREKQRQAIEYHRAEQNRKVPPPLIITAPKNAPGQTPEQAAQQQRQDR